MNVCLIPEFQYRPDPFDTSTTARLQRAGVILKDGTVNRLAIWHLADAFAGLLYTEFCDHCTEYEMVLAVKNQLETVRCRKGAKWKQMVWIFWLYDAIRKPHPEPMWLIAGHVDAMTMFVDFYITKFCRCCADESEVRK